MINQNPIICPVCGSSAVETETKASKHVFQGAGTFNVDEIVNRCSTCGEEGDFAGVNDERMNDALEIFRKKFSSNLIQNLAARDITMAWIERCLSIPQRTLHRWKSGKCTASDLALLRIIDTFPWILEVAKQGFSQKAACTAVFCAAGGIFQEVMPLLDRDGMHLDGCDGSGVIVHEPQHIESPAVEQR